MLVSKFSIFKRTFIHDDPPFFPTVPKRPKDKWFTIFYVIVGFCVVYTAIVGAITDSLKAVSKRLKKRHDTIVSS